MLLDCGIFIVMLLFICDARTKAIYWSFFVLIYILFYSRRLKENKKIKRKPQITWEKYLEGKKEIK